MRIASVASAFPQNYYTQPQIASALKRHWAGEIDNPKVLDRLLSRVAVEFLRAVGVSLHLKMPARNVTRWTPQAYVRALQDRAGDGTLAVDWWWPATAGW